MGLTSTTTDAVQIITVHSERIDAAIAIQFKEDMRRETETDATRIVLDLAGVEFIDSSGLGAIVASMKQIGSERRLDLAGLQPVVEKVFRLTRMDTVFKLFDSLDDALSAQAD